MRYLLVLTVLVALIAIPRVSHATDTTVGYSFYGPAGNYKIELFEVGAPYPSRQNIVKYNGQFTLRDRWTSIVAYRNYFIRITNLDTRVAKQTSGRYVTYNGGYYEWSPTCYWSSM